MNQVKYTIYIHQDNEVLDMGEFTNCEVPRVENTSIYHI